MQKLQKLILSMSIIALLFFSSAFFVSASSLDSTYDTMGQVSDSIDTGLNVVGEKSGEALNATTNFFDSVGHFLSNISLRIAYLLGQLPETAEQASNFSYSFMQEYGWAFLALLVLLIAGYLLFKFLQISFFRNFIIRAIAGALIIIGFIALVVWGIKQLPALPQMPDVKEYSEKTSQLLSDIDDGLSSNEVEEDERQEDGQQDRDDIQEKTNNYFVSSIAKVKDAYQSVINSAKGLVSKIFFTSQDFVNEKKEEYTSLLTPAEKITAENVYLEIVDDGIKIVWNLSEPNKNLIKSFSVARNFDNKIISITENLPADYHYYIDKTVVLSGIYSYQITAILENNKKIILNNWDSQTVNIYAKCQDNQCFFDFLNNNIVKFNEDEFNVTEVKANIKDKKNIVINIEKKSVDSQIQNSAYNNIEPLSIIGNYYFAVTAYDNITKAKKSDFKNNPITLLFDISSISINDRKNIAVAWFNEDSEQWEAILNKQFIGENLQVEVDHLSDFALVDRLPVGQVLNKYFVCQNNQPFLRVEAWAYDPDNLTFGVPDIHVYDKDFNQDNFKFLFTNKNYQEYEKGHNVALKDMSLTRVNRPEPYTPVNGVNYGFVIEKALPNEYQAGDIVDVNAYALNIDGYGNRVKRNSHLNNRQNNSLIIPDCSIVSEPTDKNLKPIGQLLETKISCQDNKAVITTMGWAYDPDNLAFGVPDVHIYDKNFNQDSFKFLFTNTNYQEHELGHNIALKDMSLTRVNRPEPYTPVNGVNYGFAMEKVLPVEYKAGDMIDINAYALNINYNGALMLGNSLLNRLHPEQMTLQVPNCDSQNIPETENWKNKSAYFDKEVFLVSNNNWQDVLSLVPAIVWTGKEGWCQRSIDAHEDVCLYPFLIFHNNDIDFDADSIIHFFQQYSPSRVTIIGSSPQSLQDLLIVDAPLGVGLDSMQVNYIAPKDIILKYWQSYQDVVYVENNYATALVASTYASLINAPLVVFDSKQKTDNIIEGKNIICVGEVDVFCNTTYTVEQLEKVYVEKTNTDKMIFVNPDDLDIGITGLLKAKKSNIFNTELYSKTSLIAPVLASAKHEIIVANNFKKHEEIGNFIEDKVKTLIPKIVNNTNGIKRDNFSNPVLKVYQKDIASGRQNVVDFLYNSNKIKLVNNKLLWRDNNGISIYNIDNKMIEKVKIPHNNIYKIDFTDKSAVYSVYENSNKSCFLYHYDFATKGINNFVTHDGVCQEVQMSNDYIVWSKMGSGYCYGAGQACENSCKGNICFSEKKFCSDNSECGAGDFCMPDVCLHFATDISVVDILTKHNLRTFEVENLKSFYLHNNNLAWVYKNINNKNELMLYKINSGQGDIFIKEGSVSLVGASLDNVIWQKGKNLYAYNINNDDNNLITASLTTANKLSVNDNTVVWLSDEECELGRCLSANLYNLKSGEKKQINQQGNIDYLVSDESNLFYLTEEKNTFYIDGYLTIIGSPHAIPYREYIGANVPYTKQNYRALDATEYADIYLNDRYPDMAVGRIQGLTISDVSGYVARALFHSNIEKTNGVFSYLREAFAPPEKLEEWSSIFSDSGYDVACALDDDYGLGFHYCQNTPSSEWAGMWMNRDFIYYDDHGSAKWAGIEYDDIPTLNNSLVIMSACSTCSTSYQNSFCNNVIRQGALAYLGAVSIAFSSNEIYDDTINSIFFEKLDVGKSFAKSFIYNKVRYMTIYLGDPTLNIRPLHYINKRIPNNY